MMTLRGHDDERHLDYRRTRSLGYREMHKMQEGERSLLQRSKDMFRPLLSLPLYAGQALPSNTSVNSFKHRPSNDDPAHIVRGLANR